MAAFAKAGGGTKSGTMFRWRDWQRFSVPLRRRGDMEAKPKAIQAAAEAYISDKGIKAVLEAAINVDRPIVD